MSTVTCDGCGATLNVVRRTRTVKCEYCSREVLVDPSLPVAASWVPPPAPPPVAAAHEFPAAAQSSSGLKIVLLAVAVVVFLLLLVAFSGDEEPEAPAMQGGRKELVPSAAAPAPTAPEAAAGTADAADAATAAAAAAADAADPAQDPFTFLADAGSGSLAQGESQEMTFDFPGQLDFSIRGSCDDDCTDLDLYLVSNGTVISKDEDEDDYPVVTGATRDGPGRAQIRVTMARCDVSPCAYEVKVHSRPLQ
jgi:DNA-directed RNA polymerase subunit RPC12/RpoP